MEKGAHKLWTAERVVILIFIAVAGGCLHFVWQNIRMFPIAQLVAPLVPVNESYWEHAKLAVTPLTVYFIVQYFYHFKDKPKGTWAVSTAAGLWSAVISMFMIHATLIAAFGKEAELVISILTFLINLWIGMSVFYCLQQKPGIEKHAFGAWVLLVLLFASMIVYSYWPLKIELFRSTDHDYFGQRLPW